MRVWSPITLLFKPLLLSLSEAARAPLIALSGVTLAAATASATLSIEAAALALRSLNGSGCSLLSTCTEDRPGVCNASCRSCVGYALDPSCCSCSRKLERHRLLAARRAHRWSPCRVWRSPPRLRRLSSRSKLLLSPSEARAAQSARCSARAPLIALSGVTLAAAAASATLLNKAAALALGSLSGTGRSLLGACTADRPVGCDARRRSCVGYAPDQAARRVSSQRPTCDCSACMSSLRLMRVWSPITLLFKPLLLSLSEAARAPLIALSGVTLAAATASATLSIKDARRVSSQRPTCDCSACMSSLRLMHVCGLRWARHLAAPRSLTGQRPCGVNLGGAPARASPLHCKASRRGLRYRRATRLPTISVGINVCRRRTLVEASELRTVSSVTLVDALAAGA